MRELDDTRDKTTQMGQCVRESLTRGWFVGRECRCEKKIEFKIQQNGRAGGLWQEGGSKTLVTPKVSGAKLQTRVISALVLGGFGGFVTLSGGLVWAAWMALASHLSAKEYFTMTATMTSELPHPPPKWAGDISILLCSIFSLVVYLVGGKLTGLVMTTLGAYSIVSALLITKQKDPHFSQFCASLFGIFYCGFLPAFWAGGLSIHLLPHTPRVSAFTRLSVL